MNDGERTLGFEVAAVDASQARARAGTGAVAVVALALVIAAFLVPAATAHARTVDLSVTAERIDDASQLGVRFTLTNLGPDTAMGDVFPVKLLIRATILEEPAPPNPTPSLSPPCPFDEQNQAYSCFNRKTFPAGASESVEVRIPRTTFQTSLSADAYYYSSENPCPVIITQSPLCEDPNHSNDGVEVIYNDFCNDAEKAVAKAKKKLKGADSENEKKKAKKKLKKAKAELEVACDGD